MTLQCFVRKRASNNTGSISTALVEAYRDEAGRPRQRILASLHGEPDTLAALAKLASLRADLREEKKALAPKPEMLVKLNELYKTVTQNALFGYQYSAADREQINDGLRLRERLLKIDAMLAVRERDGAIIKKHCSATPDEVQAAIRAYKERQTEAVALSLGIEYAIKQKTKEAKAADGYPCARGRVEAGSFKFNQRLRVSQVARAAADRKPR